ncbi:4Fe-4S dicluster domain-containing protein [Actinomycetospora cinnamomea]|uniref:Fe-S-cluster-containing dehydrogenase component n=1 Tax=Actinomycetospora cinnamomea TaxID=663609 RepID=A0A2U1F2H8_9PSEU|nr:4Fe-4S dicluster domain-containing protein [Actinomycetospora cinnamomea]PVZ06376.1 Fe-S-cluster-containing dehydrogenase component [Actinomycetospora cinnamomea]
MRYGFAIDQTTCIGCHACTVACKTEHQVPVGQFRTWVKYVDQGTFPNSTRDFGVMRCNHCTDAPCVTICPTQALFQRDDGIIDFDRDRCIGCKSCMQGCPYDAIYIDEETHTAAKCNFCAHRIDDDLEPACVVVCPTHSIWVGDLDDPSSGISRLVSSRPTQVRSPEQNTGPNVFYLGAERAVLDPLAAPADSGYIYSRPDRHRADVARDMATDPVTKARTTLNTAHPRPWGWRVTTYLWAKGVGGGAVLLAALALLLGVDLGVLTTLVAPALGVLGTAVTGGLLVWDLKRPDRFWYILTKSNPRSWLVLGAYALAAFAAVSGVWLLYGIALETGLLAASPVVWTVLAVLGIPTGLMVAGYTAFLFGQAEGRDLWQSPLLFWHLVVQAVMVGAGALAVAALVAGTDAAGAALIVRALVVATVVHVAMLLVEYLGRHATRAAATAAHLVTHGRYARLFWTAGVALALLAALVALPAWGGGMLALAALAGLAVQVALLAYESVFVRAGQDLPLS